MKKVLVFLLLSTLCLTHTFADDWSYDFENAKKEIGDRHSHLDFELNGLKWSTYSVRCNGDASDYVNGIGSIRIYGEKMSMKEMPYMTMTENKQGGIGTVSFDYRAYADHSTSQVEWMVQYSDDEGKTWLKAGETFVPTMEVQKFTAVVDEPTARIRIVRADFDSFDLSTAGTFASAFNIDDMKITDCPKVDPTKEILKSLTEKLSFETIEAVTQTTTSYVTVVYKNLKEPIKSTVEGGNGCFIVKNPSIDVTNDGEKHEAKIEIEFAPSTHGVFEAVLHITSGANSIQLSMDGEANPKHGEYGFSGGKGTAEDPYLISFARDLIEMSDSADSQITFEGRYFKMTNDIDLGRVGNFRPIGHNLASCSGSIRPFKGTFDGSNYTVRNVHSKYKGVQNLGVALFGVTENATIKNLKIDESSFYADALVAPVVAVCMGTTISNCHVGSGVTSEAAVQFYAGGVVAGAMNGACVIEDCSSAATVKTKTYGAAGILGACSDGAGGTIVRRCVNFGTVDAFETVGGIVATCEQTPLTIEDCVNFGTLDSGAGACGIMYIHTPNQFYSIKINNCYNAAELSTVNQDNTDPVSFGDMFQDGKCKVDNCYYADDMSDVDSRSATAMLSTEMKTQDFVNKLNNGRTDGPWCIIEGVADGFPVPFATAPSSIDGVEDTTSVNILFDGSMVKVSGAEADETFRVTDMCGRTVISVKADVDGSAMIDVTSLPSGVYAIGNASASKKIVK